MGPTYAFEYSTRDTYGKSFNWPEDGPLNATWWHRVTESMPSLLALSTHPCDSIIFLLSGMEKDPSLIAVRKIGP